MPDIVTIDHPCVRRTKVPVWTKPPMTAAEFTDPATPISDYAAGLIAYIFADTEKED